MDSMSINKENFNFIISLYTVVKNRMSSFKTKKFYFLYFLYIEQCSIVRLNMG